MLFAEILSAMGAGCATTIVGHPLDSIKVHLQTNPSLRGSTWAAATSLYGQNALFRGIGPPLANAILMNTVMFSVFSTVKKSIGDDDSMRGALLAGTISGFATACVSTPTDYVKIQAQLRGMSSTAILQHCGYSLPTLFRGHVSNLCREGVFTMTYLGLYDQAKVEGFWQVAMVSSLTGGLAWIVSYPFDTIKSIIQSRPYDFRGEQETLLTTTKRIVKEGGGLKALYRGCGASTGRAVMVTSFRMIVYECIMDLFKAKRT